MVMVPILYLKIPNLVFTSSKTFIMTGEGMHTTSKALRIPAYQLLSEPHCQLCKSNQQLFEKNSAL